MPINRANFQKHQNFYYRGSNIHKPERLKKKQQAQQAQQVFYNHRTYKQHKDSSFSDSIKYFQVMTNALSSNDYKHVSFSLCDYLPNFANFSTTEKIVFFFFFFTAITTQTSYAKKSFKSREDFVSRTPDGKVSDAYSILTDYNGEQTLLVYENMEAFKDFTENGGYFPATDMFPEDPKTMKEISAKVQKGEESKRPFHIKIKKDKGIITGFDMQWMLEEPEKKGENKFIDKLKSLLK